MFFFRLSDMECNENPSSRSRIRIWVQQTSRQADSANIIWIFCKFLCECPKNIALPSSKFCLSHTHTHTHTHTHKWLWHLQVHIWVMCVFQTLCYPLVELLHIYRIAYVLAPLILNLGTRRKEVCSFTILPLCLRGLTSPHWGAGWVHPHSPSKPFGQETNFLSPPGTEQRFPDYPTRNHVTHMCILKRVPWDFALNMYLHVDKFLIQTESSDRTVSQWRRLLQSE